MAEGNTGSKIIIIIVILLVVILLGIAAAFFFLTQSGKEVPNPIQQEQNQVNNTTTTQSPATAGTISSNYTRVGMIYQLDQFIVNLQTQSGRRYLKTTIGLEMTTPNLENELNTKRVPIRDTIINILSSKSLEEVSTQRGKDKLKEEIAQRINESLVDGKIRNVFFIDFAVQ